MNKLAKKVQKDQGKAFSKKIISEVKAAAVGKSPMSDKDALELSKVAYRNESFHSDRMTKEIGHEIFKVLSNQIPGNKYVGIDFIASEKFINSKGYKL